MSYSDSTLFAAGHGFYQFAISREIFDRSLYYNLLLQPSLAIPDHYLLQGEWVGSHLSEYPSRDSWLENGLRNGFIAPYFRRESSKLSDLLNYMEGVDRRGFSRNAKQIAERIDRTPFRVSNWSSPENSARFGDALTRYLREAEPPMMEMRVDPNDFIGFWNRSRLWIGQELSTAAERSFATLGSEGVLLSQLIQVTGERLLGSDCGRIGSVDELLARTKERVGATAERDLRAYYTCVCELYNRSLADAILTAPNSPRWDHFVAAMDLWRDNIISNNEDSIEATRSSISSFDFDVSIRLPSARHLRLVSGDILLAIRSTQASERYFESLHSWRSAPHESALQEELVAALYKYSEVIMKHVGQDVGALGFKPQFISKVSDVSRVLEKVPGVVQGFLAVGATAGAVGGMSSPLVSAGFFTLFCLQAVARYYSPSGAVGVELSARDGVRLHADVTISRA
jgi:hypothetical protein